MVKEKKNQTGLEGISAGEMALNAAIEAEKSHPSKFLSAGVHALYRLIQHDPSLKSKFLQAFLDQILEELEQYAQSGTLADIGRHQMMSVVYGDIPEIKKHMKDFTKKMSEAGYSWVGLVLRRIETGVTSGMQVGNEDLLINSLHDLQRYIAVTGGIGVFGKLRGEVHETLQQFYRKKLISNPSANVLTILQRKQQLDRLVEACTIQGILDSGLEEIQHELETSKKCRPLLDFAEAHATLTGLETKLDQLRQAREGVDAARKALRDFKQNQIEPGLRRAIERGQTNVPGVVEWHKEFAHLNQIHEFALNGELEPQISSVQEQIEKQNKLYITARDVLSSQIGAGK